MQRQHMLARFDQLLEGIAADAVSAAEGDADCIEQYTTSHDVEELRAITHEMADDTKWDERGNHIGPWPLPQEADD